MGVSEVQTSKKFFIFLINFEIKLIFQKCHMMRDKSIINLIYLNVNLSNKKIIVNIIQIICCFFFFLIKHIFIVYDKYVVSGQCINFFIDLANKFILTFCKDMFINSIFTVPSSSTSHRLLYVRQWSLFIKSEPSQFH